MTIVYCIKVVDSVVVQSTCYRSSGPVTIPDGFVEVDEATWLTAPAGATQNPDGTFTPPAS